MGNTQRVWTLYGVVSTLNFLSADEQRVAAGIVNKTAKLKQPRYYCRDILRKIKEIKKNGFVKWK